MGYSREREHQDFLSWLLQTLEKEQIEVLLVSGDIFDTVTPPNHASKLYYNFLSKTTGISSLKKVVVVAGNHDSVHHLSAPKDVLENLDVKVIASGEDIDDEVIHIPEIGTICAVPYLRDRVVKSFKTLESSDERKESIQVGIQKHYEEVYKKAKEVSGDLPIVATGHLTTLNSEIGDGERNIYIGNLDGVPSSYFPPFDYIALGHLHKFQKVSNNIFYSGSPIPLTFKEARNKQFVVLKNGDETREIEVPRFRELYSISTSLNELEEKLSKVKRDSFVEIFVSDDYGEHVLNEINRISKMFDIHILSKRFSEAKRDEHKKEKAVNLNSVKHEDIFLELIENEEKKEGLIEKYRETVNEVEI
jgi:exonuclease SbcD